MWRPAAEQSAAESAAAESMERRAGTKGNASQQSTCRAQSRISVSQAPDRMRQLLAVWTRGGSRMRESRTYGSVRGACDETHVPTATAPRVHLSCPGRSAARSLKGVYARLRGLWRSDALQTRDRQGRVCNGPGSAVHHS